MSEIIAKLDGDAIAKVYMDALGDPKAPWVVASLHGKHLGRFPSKKQATENALPLGVRHMEQRKQLRDRVSRLKSAPAHAPRRGMGRTSGGVVTTQESIDHRGR